MTNLSKISLHNLSQAELTKREEALLKGGTVLPCLCVVACRCLYEGEQEGPDDPYYGGATKEASGAANQPNTQASGHRL